MGASSSVHDPRPLAQRNLEKSVGVQLMIPYTVLGPRVEILAVGRFEGGEFHQTADLNVNNLFKLDDVLEPEVEERQLTFSQSTTDGNHKSIVNVKENWKIQKVELLRLNKTIIGKKVNKRMYGFEKDLYVVRAIHTASKFGVACDNRGIDYTEGGDEPRVWGYQLVKYRINSAGILGHDSKFSKIY